MSKTRAQLEHDVYYAQRASEAASEVIKNKGRGRSVGKMKRAVARTKQKAKPTGVHRKQYAKDKYGSHVCKECELP